MSQFISGLERFRLNQVQSGETSVWWHFFKNLLRVCADSPWSKCVCVCVIYPCKCMKPVKRRSRPRAKHFNEGDETTRRPEQVSDQDGGGQETGRTRSEVSCPSNSWIHLNTISCFSSRSTEADNDKVREMFAPPGSNICLRALQNLKNNSFNTIFTLSASRVMTQHVGCSCFVNCVTEKRICQHYPAQYLSHLQRCEEPWN